MRTVVELAAVMAAVDDAPPRWQQADDAWAAVTWVLAHDPSAGVPLVEGGQFRALVYVGSRVHDMPTIYVLYEITSQEIVICQADFRDAAANAGSA